MSKQSLRKLFHRLYDTAYEIEGAVITDSIIRIYNKIHLSDDHVTDIVLLHAVIELKNNIIAASK